MAPTVTGYLSLAAVPFLFGSTYVPVKIFDAGDGMFAQWMMCIGLMFPGLISSVISGTTQFYYLVMVGGVLYSAANVISIFVMDGTGMVLSALIWNTSVCLVSWAVARFGILVEKEVPNNNVLNVVAIVVLVIGGVLFSFVKNTPIRCRPHPLLTEADDSSDEDPVLEADPSPDDSSSVAETERRAEGGESADTADSPVKGEAQPLVKAAPRIPKKYKRILCIVLAIGVGFLYANMLLPVKYLSEREDYPSDVMVYMFSFSLGAMLSSTIMFVIYAFFFKKNVPIMNPNIAAPAICAGIIYGSGVVFMAVSTAEISQIVAFPVGAMSPSLINASWAILLFGEIQGKKNLSLFGLAFAVTTLGVLLLTLSKTDLV